MLTVVKKNFPGKTLYVIPEIDKKSAWQNLSYDKHISQQNKRRLSKLGVRFDVVDENDFDGDLNLDRDFRSEARRQAK